MVWLDFINNNIVWFVILVILIIGRSLKVSWLSSIRSITTILFAGMFVQLALLSRIAPKDVMLIMSLVVNFYFLVKNRDVKK